MGAGGGVVARAGGLMWGLFTPAGLWMTGLLGVAFVGVFHRWFFKQHEYSLDKLQDWGHAYAIPFISGYLIWQKRAELAAESRTQYWPGLVPFAFGIMAYFFFVVGIPNHMLQGFSMLLCLFGLLLAVLGTGAMRHLFLPLAYLAFGITISEMIMIKVTFQLQLLASQGAYVLLNMIGAVFGFHAEVDGNTLTVITSTGTQLPLNVAEACSGMRMVIAFYALAGAVALISCRHWWQRIALLLLAAPVALLMNVIRVAVLGIGTMFDPSIAQGDIHMFIGTLLLVPSLALFMGVLWALNKMVDDGPPAKAAVRAPSRAGAGLRTPAFVATLVVMIVASVGMGMAIRAAGLHLRKKPIYPEGNVLLSVLPTETASWRREGSDRIESAETQEVLGTANYISRLYVLKGSEKTSKPIAIDFHAAYYTGMIDTVPHVPDRCFVGGGLLPTANAVYLPLELDSSRWILDEDVPAEMAGRIYKAPLLNEFGAVSDRVRLPKDPDQIRFKVTEFTGPKGRGSIFAGYFFVANGGTTPDAEGVRLLAFDLREEYAYYLKVQFTSTTVATPEELAEHSASLLNELFPHLMRCVPDWVEVVKGNYPPDNPRRGTGTGSGSDAG